MARLGPIPGRDRSAVASAGTEPSWPRMPGPRPFSVPRPQRTPATFPFRTQRVLPPGAGVLPRIPPPLTIQSESSHRGTRESSTLDEEYAMGVDSGALIKTLNPTCLNALQAAAGLCLSRTNPSVEVEHWLVKLIEAPNTDLTRIFKQFEVDPARLLRDLTQVMDQFRTGNQRTPTLSLRIDQIARTAWVLASIQYQAAKV